MKRAVSPSSQFCEQFQSSDLKTCQGTYDAKLDLAKDQLKSKIQHWLVQWRTAAEKWIDQIQIIVRADNLDLKRVESGKLRISIQFPSTIGLTFEFVLKGMQSKPNTGYKFIFVNNTTTYIDNKLPVDLFVKYRYVAELEDIPVNLHGDLVFHLMAAFTNGGNAKANENYSYDTVGGSMRHQNWLFLEACHAFPGCFESVSKSENGWVDLPSVTIEVGGLLVATKFYRKLLIDKLLEHQFSRLVHYNFHRRGGGLLERARKFANSLYFYNLMPTPGDHLGSCTVGMLLHPTSGTSVTARLILKFTLSQNVALDEKVDIKLILATTATTAIETIIIKPTLQVQLTGKIMEVTSYWAEANKQRPNIVNSMIDLAVSDIEWILSAFVQANLIGEVLKTIINAPDSQFPTAMDSFDNFDPPHLRGILGQTVTSLRLSEHAENVECVRKQAMESTSSVPVAVVDIAESYLPV